MRLEGLTPRQVELCELLWSMESMDEVMRFLECLAFDELCEATAMMHLLLAEHLDAADLGDCTEARDALAKIGCM